MREASVLTNFIKNRAGKFLFFARFIVHKGVPVPPFFKPHAP